MRFRTLNRSGFASMMAVVSLFLIGVTIAGLMTRISMEARRTQAEIHRAQQEQIEIAKALASGAGTLTIPS